MTSCPSCASPVPEGARFCSACGQSLVERADQRRVATVVFADLVGFTALAESRDPETVKNLVDGCFERLVAEITAFGGRVDKIIGDAIVALFGAPIAHEDDAERAVRAALRMQEVLAEHVVGLDADIRMRIGVNTGEVLVGALRSGGDYTAMGDAVNVAQRLEAEAEPGQVLVGAATFASTKDVISYEPAGSKSVRNREEAVDAWRALGASSLPGRRPRRVRAPFVGRVDEMALAAASIRLAVRRDRAQLVTIVGEAGVGKSRLAEEISRRASRDHAALVLEGRCVPYGESNPFFAVAEAIRSGLSISIEGPDTEVVDRLRRIIGELTGTDPTSPSSGRMSDGLLALFGLPTPLDTIDPQRASEEIQRAVLLVLESWLRRSPVVLVLSDLQWAGDRMIELVGFVLERVTATAFVVITTTRPSGEGNPPLLVGRHSSVLVQLDPLDREASSSLLDLMLGGTGADQREQLLDRAGGNPLFLEELAALVDTGETAAELPDTLRGLVVARLDRLDPDERAMIDNASILGPSGNWAGLDMFGRAMGQKPTRAVLNRLAALDLLDVENNRWSFRSESVRDVAYSTLTKAARAVRHYGIAETLISLDQESLTEQIAHHFTSAAEAVRDLGPVSHVPTDVAATAIDWLERAGRSLLVSAPLRSAELAQRGLELGESGGGRPPSLLLAAANALSAIHRLNDATALVDELLVSTSDPTLLASGLTTKATIEQEAGRFDRAAELGDRAIAAWRALGVSAGIAQALRVRGLIAVLRLDVVSAEPLLTEARSVAAAQGDDRGVAWADQHLAWASFVNGDLDVAERRIAAASAAFAELGDVGGLGWALGLSAWVRFQQGRFDEAESLAHQIEAEADARGDRWARGMMRLLLANVRLWTGRSSAALKLAESAMATFRSIGDRHGIALTMAPLLRASIAVGNLAETNRWAEAAWALQEQTGWTTLSTSILAGGDVHLGIGARHEYLVETDVAVASVESRTSLAMLALQAGDLETAQIRSAEALTVGADHPYALAVGAMVTAAAGDLRDAEDLARSANAGDRASYLDRVTALVVIAAVEARTGRGTQALVSLSEGRALADATEDVVAHLLIRVAELEVREFLGLDANEIRWIVNELVDGSGIALTGWRRAIEAALGPSAAVTASAVPVSD